MTFLDQDVEKALLYRYKYRARNINGWGEFSEVSYLYAANVPSTPDAPTLIQVDTTSIQLQMYVPIDTGGANLISYELFMDEGDTNTVFSPVTSYADLGGSTATLLTHTLTTVADGMVTGKIYTFKFRASNSVGSSEFSQLLRIGLGA